MAVNSRELCSESFMLTDEGHRQLHVRRFYADRHRPVAVLWHGLAESGQVFYPNENGLALELAAGGFDVFVVDARGKGRSWPAVDETARCTTYSSLHEDVLQLCEFIEMECGVLPHVWIGHGAGVPLIGAALARFSELRQSTVGWVGIAPDFTGLSPAITYLASKILAPWLGKIPSGIAGPEPEWVGLFSDAVRWKDSSRWVDSVDGMDYSDMWGQYRFPPAIMFAGSRDLVASPAGILSWIRSLRRQEAPVMVCQGAKSGRAMLQSPYWTRQIANKVVEWFGRKQEIRITQNEEGEHFDGSSYANQAADGHCSTTAAA